MNIIINTLLFLFITYFINIYNTLLLFISIDNFAFALDFIINISKSKYITTNDYKEIIINNNKLYLGNIFERYIYYIGLCIIYNLIYFFVISNNILIKYIFCILIIPDIYNYIYETYEEYFTKIYIYKNYIIKIFLADQVTNIIKFLSKKYIDDIIIDKEHIKITLIETDTLISEIYLFIKNFLIVLLMMYFRSKSIFYYKIVKYIYIYNSGNYYIANINLETCKENLKQIIKEKNYTKLNEPQIIQSMLYLYYSKKDDKFDMFINKFNYNIIEFFTLWTIGSFFNDYTRLIILIIFWIGFSLKNNKIREFNKDLVKKYVIPIYLTLFVTIFFNSNIIVQSFIIQFSNPLIFNRITKSFFNTIYNNFYNNIILNRMLIFNTLHQNIIPFAKYYLFAFILKYILYKNKIQYIHYTCLFWMFITNIDKDLYSKYLYLILYLSIINKNNFVKISILCYILSLINNCIKYKFNNRDILTFNDLKQKIINTNKYIYNTLIGGYSFYKDNLIKVNINQEIITSNDDNRENYKDTPQDIIIKELYDAINDDSNDLDLDLKEEIIENYL